jgi:hypothetical protein
MNDSLTIKEIRETRKKISARFDHDIDKLVDHYLEKQRNRGEHQHPPLLPELKIKASRAAAASSR